jgi:hypothetical protein
MVIVNVAPMILGIDYPDYPRDMVLTVIIVVGLYNKTL